MKLFFKITAWFLAAVLFACLCVGAYLWYIWSSNLPYIGAIKEYRPPIITRVYSSRGELIGRFWKEKRIIVSLDELPPRLIQAFLAAEDSRFFEHRGVDILSIFRAFTKNLKAGKITQGGSTITQQVTKSLLLKNTEKTYRRKAREALLAVQLEKSFSKEKILFLYLNEIYLGQGAYGVEAAARTYFNKSSSGLSLAESAMLAGLPQAPARYSPVMHLDRAKMRQRYVLDRMVEEGYITEIQAEEAFGIPLEISGKTENAFAKAPYFTEYIRRYLEKKYGRELLYSDGLRVYTTLDLEKQKAAQKALKKGLADLDKREGYRGPEGHVPAAARASYLEELEERLEETLPKSGVVVEALVKEVHDDTKHVVVWIGREKGRLPLSRMKWARKPDPEVAYYQDHVRKPSAVLKPGDKILVRLLEKSPDKAYAWDVALEQDVEIQGAVFCMDIKSGEVLAMVGGRNFSESQFNRAVQSRRQPGSAFKPVIYAAALDHGMKPSSVILDSPYVSYNTPDKKAWKPSNYKEKFYGPTLLRTGLIKSRNVITIKLLKEIGVSYAISYARKLGIESELAHDFSLALGSSGLSLMELTRAYAVFANQGTLVKPTFIRRVEDRRGEIIEESQISEREVISRQTAYIVTDLLRGVIQEGTGWRVRALKRPAAGKTGTTNDLKDAWFMGYSPALATGVWVGYDDVRPMGKGETGSRAASPIWLDFMSQALEGRPVVDFDVPEGVVFTRIDAETGLLPAESTRKTVLQAFREGHEPEELSPPPDSPKAGNFMQFDMDAMR